MEVPVMVMEACYESMEVMKTMSEKGLSNSVSDAGVGALCARTGVVGAWLNVRINAAGIDDAVFVKALLEKGQDIVDKAIAMEKEILDIVDQKINEM